MINIQDAVSHFNANNPGYYICIVECCERAESPSQVYVQTTSLPAMHITEVCSYYTGMSSAATVGEIIRLATLVPSMIRKLEAAQEESTANG